MNPQEVSMIVESVVNGMRESQKTSSMTLSLAQALTQRVLEKAKEMGVKAVVAVSNAGARPVSVVCCGRGVYRQLSTWPCKRPIR